jgi:tetratricopeptide (TPR) repeat protein
MRSDNYALLHLAAHLIAAERWPDLIRLLESPKWFQLQEDFDPSLGIYLRGLANGLENVEKIGNESLPCAIGWSLLYSSLSQDIAATPTEAIEALALLGQKEESFGLVGMIRDPGKLFATLGKLVPILHMASNHDHFEYLIQQGLDQTNGLSAENRQRVHAICALSQLAGQLGERNILEQTLLDAAEMVPRDRLLVLSSIAPAAVEIGDNELAQGVLNDALVVVSSVDYAAQYYSSEEDPLNSLAKVAAPLGDRQCLLKVIDFSRSVQDDMNRSFILISISESALALGERGIARQLLSELVQGMEDGSATSIQKIQLKWAFLSNLSRISEIAYQLGDFDASQRLIGSLKGWEADVYSIESCDAARRYARSGHHDLARQAMEYALNVSMPPVKTFQEDRTKALVTIVKSATDLGFSDLAEKALNEAVTSLTRASNTDARYLGDKAESLAILADLAVHIGNRSLLSIVFSMTREIDLNNIPFYDAVLIKSYAKIAKAAALLHDKEKARSALVRVRHGVLRLNTEYMSFQRTEMLGEMATIATQLGEKQLVREIISSGIRITKNSQGDPYGNLIKAFIPFVTICSELEEQEMALWLLKKALVCVSSVMDVRQGISLSLLIDTAAKINAGEILEKALAQALDFTSEGENYGINSLSLAMISLSAARCGRMELAKSAIEKTFSYIRSTSESVQNAKTANNGRINENNVNLIKAYVALAQAVAQTEANETWMECLLDAFRLSEDILDGIESVEMLLHVSTNARQLGKKDLGRLSLEHALTVANVSPVELKSYLYAIIAVYASDALDTREIAVHARSLALEANRPTVYDFGALTQIALVSARLGEWQVFEEMYDQSLQVMAHPGDDVRYSMTKNSGIPDALRLAARCMDQKTPKYLISIMRILAFRGSPEDIMLHIRDYASVLADLGNFTATWEHIKAGELILAVD